MAGGDSIDAALIAEGLGNAWTRDGQHRDYLVGLARQAIVVGVGCLGTPANVATGGCDPAYPDVCIPPRPPDLDCGHISHVNFRVLPPDPHGFDGSGWGWVRKVDDHRGESESTFTKGAEAKAVQ